MENTSAKRSIHVGHNIQRFRLMRGLSQSGLAHLLEKKRGKPVSQQIISDIEDRERVADEELLKQIAEALDVSPEALENLDLDYVINIISNTFTESQIGYHINNNASSNHLNKLIEFYEKENEALKAEIESLRKENGNLKKKKK